MSEYHEPPDELPDEVRDIHRALKSLQEELEAVDWYHQRVATCSDPALRDILAHNRDEEIEHAAMVLEWLRRHMPVWNTMLERFLFTEGSLDQLEDEREGAEKQSKRARSTDAAVGLGIGGRRQAVSS